MLSGGTEIISSGGTATATIVLSGGTLQLMGGAAPSGPSVTVSSGGTLAIGSGFTLDGTVSTVGEIVQIQSSGAYSGLTNRGDIQIYSLNFIIKNLLRQC